MRLATHSQRLERWLGPDEIESLVESMKDWHGPPIAVGNVPGKVYVTKNGDFRGHIEAGSEASIWDKVRDYSKRMEARADYSFEKFMRKHQMHPTLNGFSSLSDLIAEASAGKSRQFMFQKIGTTGTTGFSNSLWGVGNQPAAGAAGAAAPGGTAHVDSNTGGFIFDNPTGGDTQHFVSGFIMSSVQNQLLLYDRLFSVAKTMSNNGTESVTGVPSRYQNTTSGNVDSADGNFLFIETQSVLSNTAHNWTTCLYTDQNGNGTSTLPSVTGNVSSLVNALDHPINRWFCPLATGDTGIKELDQMQCSSNAVTGAINFVIGHPIAWIPCTIANFMIPVDGIQSAFQLERIFDDACLSFLEVLKSAATATTYTGTFKTVAG